MDGQQKPSSATEDRDKPSPVHASAAAEVKRRIDELEARLRQTEMRARIAEEAGHFGTFDLNIATGMLSVSPEFCHVFGFAPATSYPASAIENAILPEDRMLGSTTLSRRAGTAPLETEYRIRRADTGETRWILRRARFVTAPDSAVTGMVGTVTDLTDARLAAARGIALLDLGDQLRDALSIEDIAGIAGAILGRGLEVSHAGYAQVDVQAGTFTVEASWNAPDTTALDGRYPVQSLPATFAALLEGRPVLVSDVRTVDGMESDQVGYEAMGTLAHISIPLMEDGKLTGSIYVQSTMPRLWTTDERDFVRQVADRIYSAVTRVRAATEQRLLNEELSHRLKNMLAMVQAIATQTLRGVADRAAVEGFEKRIVALSKAHDVLLQQSWSAARMRAIAEGVLSLHADLDRFMIDGPDILLGPKATLSLSLILHELATNAVKYGSLSNETGQVMLNWRVEAETADQAFVITWKEQGGPPVVAPQQRGFGSKLIRMGISGTGRVEKHYLSSGFTAEFHCPMSSLLQK